MTPVEIIREAEGKQFFTENGKSLVLDISAGLSHEELRAFEATLPCPLTEELRELLSFCSGFTLQYDVDFLSHRDSLGCEEIFPNVLPFVADGFGNFWVFDLWSDSKSWEHIYYHCHDPSMVLFQCNSLSEFLSEFFKMFLPPFESKVADVHDDQLYEVTRKHPCEESFYTAVTRDEKFATFAQDLGDAWTYIDLRDAKPGMGFDWARFGIDTEIRRMGREPIFAYRPGPKKPDLMSRLFGKRS